jgi:hypothetical protein
MLLKPLLKASSQMEEKTRGGILANENCDSILSLPIWEFQHFVIYVFFFQQFCILVVHLYTCI